MPKVGGKEFPYTKEGKQAAAKAKKKLAKRKRIPTDNGYMRARI